jgi:D-lyxose ketol-isomerase
MFRFHRYSLADVVLDSPDFWMLEFGQNDFSNVGMAGIFFVNDKEHGYFGHEIFLLPGQMIAEHYHIPGEGLPAKHEAWQVRHGQIWTVAQGGDKSKLPFVLPASQDKDFATCFDAKELQVGGMDFLRKLEEPHFMMAGPEGAIVTEYASYHSGDGLRFSNPNVKL